MWQHRLRREVTARTEALPTRLEETGLVVNILGEQPRVGELHESQP